MSWLVASGQWSVVSQMGKVYQYSVVCYQSEGNTYE